MFRFLVEADEPHDAAEAGSAPAEAVAPEAPPRGNRCQARGLREKLAQRLAAGRTKRRLAATDEALTAAVAASNPSVAEAVSQSFGFKPKVVGDFRANVAATTGGDTFLVDKRRSETRLLRRGIFSHALARIPAIRNFWSNVTMFIHCDILDDATMWVRRPLGKSSSLPLPNRRSRQRKPLDKKRVGRNTAVQVMNVIQHCFSNGIRGAWCSCRVHAPAIAVPQANWATLLHRKRAWSLCTGGVVGHQLDRDGTLQARLNEIAHIGKHCTNDGASNNLCMIGAEQRELISRRHGGQFLSHIDVRCMAHAACLVVKPSYMACGEVPTIITRLSHILQGSRPMNDFLSIVEKIVEQSFVFERRRSLPAEHAAWRRDGAWILEASRCAMDLDQSECDEILAIDNCSWQEDSFRHVCLGEHYCEAHCTDAAQSLELMKASMRRRVQAGLPVALLYRWKAMDRALAFATRAIGSHNILWRALRQMWSKKDPLSFRLLSY